MKKYHKTTVQIEILSKKPYYPNEYTLDDINHDIRDEHCSGVLKEIKREELTGKEMADALVSQNSDPGFFQKAELREWGKNIVDSIKYDRTTYPEAEEPHCSYGHLFYFWKNYEGGKYAQVFDKSWQFDLWNEFTWKPTVNKFLILVNRVVAEMF